MTAAAFDPRVRDLAQNIYRDIVSKALQVSATSAEMKSDPNDAASPTFGELIKQGKLPGGEDNAQAAAE